VNIFVSLLLITIIIGIVMDHNNHEPPKSA